MIRHVEEDKTGDSATRGVVMNHERCNEEVRV
jgi:hypothetical protein